MGGANDEEQSDVSDTHQNLRRPARHKLLSVIRQAVFQIEISLHLSDFSWPVRVVTNQHFAQI